VQTSLKFRAFCGRTSLNCCLMAVLCCSVCHSAFRIFVIFYVGGGVVLKFEQ
jgi:hypothetical protein